MRTLTQYISAALALVALSIPASAVTQTIPLNFTFSGTPLSGPAPWLSLSLQDGFGPNTVRLTMDAFGLTGQQYVAGWYLNLRPTLNASQLTFTRVSPASVTTTNNIFSFNNIMLGDGGGLYDILFDFPPPLLGSSSFASKFTAGEKFIVDVTRPGGLNIADFRYLSIPPAPNGVYYTAARIRTGNFSIDNPLDSSNTWIGATIPETSTYALLMGGAAMGFLLLRKRSSGET